MRTIVAFLSLGVISIALFAFQPAYQSMNQGQATAKARSFASARGSALASAPVRARERQGVGRVSIYEVVFQTKYGVKVDVEAATGRVVSYRDNDALERRRLTGAVKEYKLADRRAAARFVDQLANKLGLPSAWKRVGLDYYRDNTPGRGDSDRSGAVTASYQPSPKGYPHFNFPPSMRLRIDPADGRLLEYTFFNHTTVGEAKVVITKQRATSIAEAAHAREHMVSRASHRAISETSLGWAVPNGMFGSKLKPDTTAPFAARLVHKVPFSGSFIWIDAATSEVVGGDVYK